MPSLAYPFKDNITYEKQISNFFADILKKIRQNELYRCKFSSPAPTAAAKGKSESISLIITILAILAGLLIGFLMLRFSETTDEQVDTEQLLEELTEELKQKK